MLVHVVRNIYENVPDDESREMYRVPKLVEDMIERGWLGEKTGSGFYKRVKKGGESEILTLDWHKMEYRPRQKAKFGSIEAGKGIEDTRERLRALVSPALEGKGGDKANQFLWSGLSETCLYAARRVPEIANSIVDVDRAMRWGFGWELGPFEMWNAIGVERMAKALEREGKEMPPLVAKVLEFSEESFLRNGKGQHALFRSRDGVAQASGRAAGNHYFEIAEGAHAGRAEKFGREPDRPGRRRGLLRVSLEDEFDWRRHRRHDSRWNRSPGFGIRGHGDCQPGAEFFRWREPDAAADQRAGGEWDDIHMAVRQFQRVNMAIKYAPRPVVVAPQGMAFGGGCEISLHGARIHAAAESYIGLVEAGVGLIPGGGGTKEMLIRANEHSAGGENLDLFHALKPVFETIAMAKVSTSAEEARSLGFLRPSDLIAMNRDRQVADAKQTALAMVRAGYHPPAPAEIRVLGEEFLAAAKLAIHMLVRGEYASEYDAVVARKLAYILAGGGITAPQTVSEQYILDLEREAFRQPLRPAQDSGTRRAHSEDRQTLAQLSETDLASEIAQILWLLRTRGNP